MLEEPVLRKHDKWKIETKGTKIARAAKTILPLWPREQFFAVPYSKFHSRGPSLCLHKLLDKKIPCRPGNSQSLPVSRGRHNRLVYSPFLFYTFPLKLHRCWVTLRKPNLRICLVPRFIPCQSQGTRGMPKLGKLLTICTVSRLTVITCPINRTIYCSSSRRFGSLTMPLRLSVLTRYWSIIQSKAERFPKRYANAAGGIPLRVRNSL